MCNTACQSLKTNANVKVECIRGKERATYMRMLTRNFIYWKTLTRFGKRVAAMTIDFAQKSHRKLSIYWKNSPIRFFLLSECPFAFSTHTHISWNAPPSINYQQMRRKKNTTREHNNWRMKFNIVLVSYLICLVSKLRAEKRAELEFQFI